ncbi:hypothetical protein [Clostridium sp. ZS2]|uniref:hypothetical protein n=1 Tax=Clostridium sp. ZS2 TaxID=2949988 RepID=UPI00207A9649|nr:hypothetical protein [Clostridium sp. ZS2]
MKPSETEFQDFINQVKEVKMNNYEEFLRIKYMIDGIVLSKKVSKENLQVCSN